MTEIIPMKGNLHYEKLANEDLPAEQALVHATLALAWEQRTANLIQCSQKVYVPGANDEIKARLGGVGVPTPDSVDLNAVVVAALHKAMTGICFSKPYDETDGPGDVTSYQVDGELDLREVARRVLDGIAEAHGA